MERTDMSAAHAIRMARSAGVQIEVDGGDLVLRARSAPPPSILDGLSRYKPQIVALLQRASSTQQERALARLNSSDPRNHCCDCGEIGIYGEGWSFREPERARWYCVACKRPKGERIAISHQR
jgi:hypothetical protein